ncbi:hypothetical protein DY000_02047967 [Brassica cretica]|uniref:Uncharacterized protein n=1 Tax=Brassica cretica TaxID=69181 RepID=A0ABQ7F3W4_BRACR|nr:hypothetical protein DY000_02047967 [Brassica cretica]
MSFGGSHWCRSTPDTEHRSIYTNTNRSTGTPGHRSTTPTESTASCNAVKILTHEEFAAKHPYPPSPDKVRIDRHANSNVDRQPSPPIDRRAPITYRVQMPKSGELIDYGFDLFSSIVYSILEIFGASTRDDHRARQSVNIGELESIDTHDMVSIDIEARRKPVWSHPT